MTFGAVATGVCALVGAWHIGWYWLGSALVRLIVAVRPCDCSPVCPTCGADVVWQSCDTGGWWRHERHPADDHPVVLPALDQMNDDGYWITPASLTRYTLPRT